MKTIGVYAGSFDPFTVGHMDILLKACSVLDEVIVAVLINQKKQPYFSLDERLSFIHNTIQDAGLPNARTGYFDGLLIEYLRSIGANYIVRGLRSEMDFQYELQIDSMNRNLAPEFTTMYFMAAPEHSFISSSLVKEVGFYGGCIEGLIPKINHKKIAERLAKR